MNIGTDLLRAFVAVAEALNFTRAGESLHKTQSAVSQQIKRLEGDLGVQLFERRGPGVQLTPVGESFLPQARRILKVHDEALSSIADPEAFGLLKVGFSDELAMCFFPEIIRRFATYYPRVQIEMHSDLGPNHSLESFLGDLDLAVFTSTQSIPGSETIARTPLLWVASGRHPAYRQHPLPLALFEPGCSYRAYATQALTKVGVDYRIAYTSPSLAGIHSAVVSGMAVSVLIEATLPPDTAVLGASDGFPSLTTVNVQLLRGKNSNAFVDCFADLLTEVIANGKGMSREELARIPA